MGRLLSDTKCKKCLRAGMKLYLKGEKCYTPKCPVTRKNGAMPGVHPQPRRLSGYGIQFREKQKVKNMYGVMERQFRRYFGMATKVKGETGTKLLQILEMRLDNVVYRLGFAPSRSAARQLVNHGHVIVNGGVVSIPSVILKETDKVAIKDQDAARAFITQLREQAPEAKVPGWLNRVTDTQGEVVSIPTREMIDPGINEQLIVELYSR